MSGKEAAVALRKLGWNVVAAAPRGKTPIGSWKRYQSEPIPERVVRLSFADGNPNLFVITGAVSRLAVLDCDDEAAEAYWREQLGDEVLDATTQVRTGGGKHYYFRLAEGQAERGRLSSGGDSGKWDLRAEGGGVIAPPSVHPTGRKYEWVDGRGPEALQDAPDGLWARGPGSSQEVPRSVLSHLLSNPPAEGGRNMWLSRVAGHYALHIPHQDAYEVLVRQANDSLPDPLPEHEVAKIVDPIWRSEQAKVGKLAEPVADEDTWRSRLSEPAEATGWLVSGGVRILVQTRKKTQGGGWELGLDTWMDSDIRVLGLVKGDDGELTYEVEMRRSNGEVVEASLPAAVAANAQRLPIWLGNLGVSIGVPDDIYPSRMRESTRIIRYLEAQRAPKLEAVPYLGWHDESRAFITHDHIIREGGPEDFEAVRPSPAMRGWAKYRYGHEHGVAAAREVLGRVLEFHDETVAAVFGSWWAAALLKPQVQRVVSQFPFMALEAASESGKTTGFFNLMMQLSGHYGGQSNPTPAALRDALSANRSGIVWVDDLDDLDGHGELLRNVTVGGSMVKKGEDNHRQVTAQMRAALVVSGEGLGLHGQKALMDRAVLLEVPSPVGRLNRDGRPQWEDVLQLGQEYPDLTALAGSVVELALAQQAAVGDMKKVRVGSGRFADKNAIVRPGARILAEMVQEAWMVELADAWADEQDYTGSENALTLTILPAILRATGWKDKPEPPDEARRMTATPAFARDGTVWFSPALVADWPAANRRRGSGIRLETREALEDQARALGLGGSRGIDRKNFRFLGGSGRAMYWRCDEELSGHLVARSEGEEEGEQDAGPEQTELLPEQDA